MTAIDPGWSPAQHCRPNPPRFVGESIFFSRVLEKTPPGLYEITYPELRTAGLIPKIAPPCEVRIPIAFLIVKQDRELSLRETIGAARVWAMIGYKPSRAVHDPGDEDRR